MNTERIISIALAVICFLLGIWLIALTHQRDSAREESTTWKTSAQQTRLALDEITNAHARLQKALEERETKLTILEKERIQQQDKLREALRNDKEMGDWGGISLPALVDSLFQ